MGWARSSLPGSFCSPAREPASGRRERRIPAPHGYGTSLPTPPLEFSLTVHWTFLLGPGLTDGVGTGLILGYLMYRSGLVSRRMALFGVVGGPLLAASGIAVLMGVIPQGSSVQGIATAPEFIWEAFLGLWLTFKGFSASPITLGDTRPVEVDEAYRAPAAA